jgi:hypothetical protein
MTSMTAAQALERFDQDCATYRKGFDGAGLAQHVQKHRIDEMLNALAQEMDPTTLAEKIAGLISAALTNREVWVGRLVNTLAALLVPLIYLRELKQEPLTPERLRDCVKHWVATGDVPDWAQGAPHGDALAITQAIDERCTRAGMKAAGERLAVRYSTLFVLPFAIEALIVAYEIRPGVVDRHTDSLAAAIAARHVG